MHPVSPPWCLYSHLTACLLDTEACVPYGVYTTPNHQGGRDDHANRNVGTYRPYERAATDLELPLQTVNCVEICNPYPDSQCGKNIIISRYQSMGDIICNCNFSNFIVDIHPIPVTQSHDKSVTSITYCMKIYKRLHEKKTFLILIQIYIVNK